MLGELRDYTIGIIAFTPLGIGTAIYMTGGPWLEPRLRPVRRYFVLYVAAAIILNLVFALTDVGKSTFAIEIALVDAIYYCMQSLVLQLLSTTSILLQYALWQHTDITAYFVIPAVKTIMLITVTYTVTGQDEHIGSANTAAGRRTKIINSFEISEAFARDMFDATADEMIGHDVLDHPEGVERIRNARINFAPELRDGDMLSQEYSTKTFDGKLLHLKANYVHPNTRNMFRFRIKLTS